MKEYTTNSQTHTLRENEEENDFHPKSENAINYKCHRSGAWYLYGMKRSRKYLKYDSISGNLHQFFLPCYCLDCFAVCLNRREAEKFIQATVDRVILIVSAASDARGFLFSTRYAKNYGIKGQRKTSSEWNVRSLSHSSIDVEAKVN